MLRHTNVHLVQHDILWRINYKASEFRKPYLKSGKIAAELRTVAGAKFLVRLCRLTLENMRVKTHILENKLSLNSAFQYGKTYQA